MNAKLVIEALVKFLAGVILDAAMLFVPAGSLHFWQGWLLMAVLFVPIFVVGVVMILCDRELLRKRLNAKERDSKQDVVVKISGLLFIASFILAAFNWRYGWMILPDWVVWLAALVFVLCYLLYAEVLRENAYLSRNIEVVEGQRVIDTGLYSIVRHPMYTAMTLLFLAMPLVLASPISLLVMLLYVPLIIIRIKREEALLERELEGYSDYMRRVKYRLLPYIY